MVDWTIGTGAADTAVQMALLRAERWFRAVIARKQRYRRAAAIFERVLHPIEGKHYYHNTISHVYKAKNAWGCRTTRRVVDGIEGIYVFCVSKRSAVLGCVFCCSYFLVFRRMACD